MSTTTKTPPPKDAQSWQGESYVRNPQEAANAPEVTAAVEANAAAGLLWAFVEFQQRAPRESFEKYKSGMGGLEHMGSDVFEHRAVMADTEWDAELKE